MLVAVHYAGAGTRLDPTRSYKLSAPFGGPAVTDQSATLEAAKITRGAYNLSEC